MIFQIQKLKQAEKEIAQLTAEQQKQLNDDFEIITTKGIEYVKRRHLRGDVFEIKTNDIRSLFAYRENRIILIGLVYEKRTNKAPDYYIELAQKRLKEAR
ncbi:MAG: type II toxin-antitoxin system RelE/ParE family toxin [Bacteroidales bacterium]|jgi:phage-related protein|nr:type II toxin-antitoxin system RelE/ParE family toxin [Bacteroidales bacterium]